MASACEEHTVPFLEQTDGDVSLGPAAPLCSPREGRGRGRSSGDGGAGRRDVWAGRRATGNETGAWGDGRSGRGQPRRRREETTLAQGSGGVKFMRTMRKAGRLGRGRAGASPSSPALL